MSKSMILYKLQMCASIKLAGRLFREIKKIQPKNGSTFVMKVLARFRTEGINIRLPTRTEYLRKKGS
jgi:hypothetical protein